MSCSLSTARSDPGPSVKEAPSDGPSRVQCGLSRNPHGPRAGSRSRAHGRAQEYVTSAHLEKEIVQEAQRQGGSYHAGATGDAVLSAG